MKEKYIHLVKVTFYQITMVICSHGYTYVHIAALHDNNSG